MTWFSTGYLKDQSGKAEGLAGNLQCWMTPAPSSCPWPQDSPCVGPTAPCSWADERGELEETAFAQHLELLLSTKPKLEDQNHSPAGACMPCMCAHRTPGQNEWGQSLWLLKSSKVRGTSQPPTIGCPARKADAPKGENLFCKTFVIFSWPCR